MRGRAAAVFVALAVTLAGWPAQVRGQEVPPPAAPRSVGVGYALSIGGLLAPMYLAKAISNSEGDIGTPARAAMLAGICGVIREQNLLRASPTRAFVPYLTLAGRAPQVGLLGRF